MSGVESGPVPGLEGSAGDRLGMVIRAFAAGPLDAGTPQLLISRAVAAIGADGGVICETRARVGTTYATVESGFNARA